MIRQFMGAGVGSLLSIGLLASTAGAAGTSYGGTPPLAGGIPGGFSNVVVVTSVGPTGGDVTVTSGKTKISISLPANPGENVEVTTAKVSNIKSKSIKDVPKNVAKDHAVFGAGVGISKNSANISDTGLIVVTLKSFPKGDYVVVWSSEQNAFVPAPKNFASVRNGVATIKFHASEQFAILAPPAFSTS